jgi:hypothetical protein
MEHENQLCLTATPSSLLTTTVAAVSWAVASAWGQRPHLAPLRDGVAAGRFEHGEWTALLGRFVDSSGMVDYHNFQRVRRLVEVYLRRLARVEPDDFTDADDQLAFYLNAYNAIAVHQVLLHYPVNSIRQIAGAFVRIYPVGRRNVSLHLLHANLLRAFGDPRIHAAISIAARSGAKLRPFSGPNLQAELDAALRQLLADPVYGARYDAATNTLYLPAMLRWFAGDFLAPHLMPKPWHLVRGIIDVDRLASILAPYMPPRFATVHLQQSRVKALPFDWTLNDSRA